MLQTKFHNICLWLKEYTKNQHLYNKNNISGYILFKTEYDLIFKIYLDYTMIEDKYKSIKEVEVSECVNFDAAKSTDKKPYHVN